MPSTPPSLSPRERDVLRLIAAGRSNTEIASELGISFTTAKSHVTNILTKLNVETREEAARWWDGHGGDGRPSVFASWLRRFGVAWRPVAIAGGAVAVSGVVVVALLLVLVAADDEDRAAGLAPGMWVAGLELEPDTEEPYPEAAIQLYHSETGELFTVGEPQRYLQIMLAPDGRHVAGWYVPKSVYESEDDDEELVVELSIFSLPDGEETVVAIQPPNRLRWSPDGTRLAVHGMEGVDIHSVDGDLLGSVHWERDQNQGSSGIWVWAPDSSKFAILDGSGGPGAPLIVIVGREGVPVAQIAGESVPPKLDALSFGSFNHLRWEDPSTLVLAHQGAKDQESPPEYHDWPIQLLSDGTVSPREPVELDPDVALSRFSVPLHVLLERFPGSITFCDYCYWRDDGLYHLGFWYSPSVNLRDSFTDDAQNFVFPPDTRTRIAILDDAGGIGVVETGIIPVPKIGTFSQPYDLALVERP